MSRCDADKCKREAVWTVQEVTTLAALEEAARDGPPESNEAFSCDEDLGVVVQALMDEGPLHFVRIERIQ